MLADLRGGERESPVGPAHRAEQEGARISCVARAAQLEGRTGERQVAVPDRPLEDAAREAPALETFGPEVDPRGASVAIVLPDGKKGESPVASHRGAALVRAQRRERQLPERQGAVARHPARVDVVVRRRVCELEDGEMLTEPRRERHGRSPPRLRFQPADGEALADRRGGLIEAAGVDVPVGPEPPVVVLPDREVAGHERVVRHRRLDLVGLPAL